MKIKKKFVPILVFSIAIISLIGYVFFKSSNINEENKSVKLPKNDILIINPPDKIFFNGILEYSDELHFKVDKELNDNSYIFVNDGDKVKKGDVLIEYPNKDEIEKKEQLELELDNLTQEIDKLKYEKKTIKNQIDVSNKDYEHVKIGELNKSINNILFELNALEKKKNKIKEKINTTKLKLKNRITAPYEGNIVITYSDKGTEKSKVITLYSNKVIVKCDVPEDKMRLLSVNGDVKLTLLASSQQIGGKINTISNINIANIKTEIDSQSNKLSLYPVTIYPELTNIEYIGSAVQVSCVPHKCDILIPIEAVIKEKSKYFVYKIKNNLQVKSEVKCIKWNDRYYKVIKGLTFGDKIKSTPQK